jgi:hypothetical protein
MRFRLPRFQFSLRTLVIIVVIVAAAGSWHGSRYARQQARTAARVELIKAGFTLSTLEQATWLNLAKRETPESWVTRWDRYWFGEQAVTEYPVMQIRGFEFHDLEEQGKPLDYARLLSLFPELRHFSTDYHFPEGRNSVSNPLLTSPEFVAALGRLPQLEYLRTAQLGPFNDAWVALLPESSPLIDLTIRDAEFTPQGTIQLFKKCPRLKHVTLPARVFNEDLVSYLNTTDKRFQTSEGQYLSDGLQIWVEDTRLSGEFFIPDALQQLKTKFVVGFQRAWNGEPHVSPAELATMNPAPIEMQGLQAESLYVSEVNNFTVQGWPILTFVNLHEARNITVAGCAQLGELAMYGGDRLQVQANPRLWRLHLQHCGRLEISDCESLREPGGTWEVKELSLKRLPQLEKFHSLGRQLELEDLPKLETVELINPTPAQLRELQKLPRLRNLCLYLSTSRDDQELFQLLKTLPHLERLQLMDGVSPDDFPVFLQELSQLTKLRVLRLDNAWNSIGYQNPMEFISHLPPQLEVLIARTDLTTPPLLKLLQQRLPKLVYVAAGETMKESTALKQLLETDLEKTPPVEQLRPHAVKFSTPRQ